MEHNITILHELPPYNHQFWRHFSASENGIPIHISVMDICDDFQNYTNSPDECCEAYALRRLDVLNRCLTISESNPIILYTGICGLDIIPCGCTTTKRCDYHGDKNCEVAKCFCCSNMNITCSYHSQ